MKKQKMTIDERIRERLAREIQGRNQLLTDQKHIDEVVEQAAGRMEEYIKSLAHIGRLMSEESKALQAAMAHRAEALSRDAELSRETRDTMTLVNNLDVFLSADLDFLIKHLQMADDAALLIALEFNQDLLERLQDIIDRVNELKFQERARKDKGLELFLDAEKENETDGE